MEYGHNPYFNRWFSAIGMNKKAEVNQGSHNPYFNRWFSAIERYAIDCRITSVTILILIDGFLQSGCENEQGKYHSSQSLF